jgi:hypothetical protein
MINLRTQMTPKKTTPLVLMMFFTLVCTLSAAGATIPSAIAQEVTLLDEDLARGIVSDVLDGGNDDEENGDADDAEIVDQDSMDTAETVNPNQEDHTEDQTDFNEYGDNTAVSIDVDKEQLTLTPTPPSPDDRLPSEGNAVFCFQEGLILGILCSDTPEDCELVQEQFENVISECEGFEAPPPPGAAFCSISEGGKNIRCESNN